MAAYVDQRASLDLSVRPRLRLDCLVHVIGPGVY
jgi:hypothetical protein